MTAAIGIVIGMGFYDPAVYATVITLSLFRWIESKIPSFKYTNLSVRFKRSNQYTDEDALRKLITEHGIKSFEAGYQLYDHGSSFKSKMTIRTTKMKNLNHLAQSLMDMDDVHEFRITPST